MGRVSMFECILDVNFCVLKKYFVKWFGKNHQKFLKFYSIIFKNSSKFRLSYING